MLDFRWLPEGIQADFVIPDDDHSALRVKFEGNVIVRILDELELSTEDEDSSIEGLVRENFAYRVEDSVFERTQSDIFKHAGTAIHYRFITGWTCLDVLAHTEPLFSLIERTFEDRVPEPGTRPLGLKR